LPPRHNGDVRAEVDGIIAELYVDEGQRVAAGELIARLADRDIAPSSGPSRRKATRFVPGSRCCEQGHGWRSGCGHRISDRRDPAASIPPPRSRRRNDADRLALPRRRLDVAVAEERLLYARSGFSCDPGLSRGQLVRPASIEESQERAAVGDKELAAARAEFAPCPAGDLALTGDLAGVPQGAGRGPEEMRKPGRGSGYSRPGAGPREIEGADWPSAGATP